MTSTLNEKGPIPRHTIVEFQVPRHKEKKAMETNQIIYKVLRIGMADTSTIPEANNEARPSKFQGKIVFGVTFFTQPNYQSGESSV